MLTATLRLSDYYTEPLLDLALARHVSEGLSAPQKYLSSAFLYDDEGSRLFQQIMALPEYYLTRTEHEIMVNHSDTLAHMIAPDAQRVDLIELGSGDGAKTLTLCKALQRTRGNCVFHPMDISALALDELCQRFALCLPAMAVRPLCGDYFRDWPQTLPDRRQVAMLLGSNLGNLTQDKAIGLLCRVRKRLRPDDAMLLGLDLMKDPRTVLAAYNDAQGVTARFNLNLLKRLNRELQMNFALDHFSHYASYSPLDGVARSFLVSDRRQMVHSHCLKRSFDFAAGETIYTEQSQKYSASMIDSMAKSCGFEVLANINDSQNRYTLSVLRAEITADFPS